MVLMFHQHVVLIFILVALQAKSFSLARPVKEVTVVTTNMVSSSFSLQKEIIPNAANFEGNLSKKKKGSSAVGFVGKRKGGEGDSFKAFSADYHSPKRHPPKNN